jgi:hypothetical protein
VIAREAVVGIDLGTTVSKVLVRTVTGEQLALVTARTPWTTTADGGTEISADAFVDLTIELLCSGYARAAADAPLRISAVAVAGLAESGVLLDGACEPRTPVIAWYDRRGTQQIDSVSLRNNGFGLEFARRTGLPLDCQASVAKVLWFVDDGIELTPAHRWLSVPEYVVFRLGGELVHEPSNSACRQRCCPPASRTARVPEHCGTPRCPMVYRVPRSLLAGMTIRWRPSVSAPPVRTNCSIPAERPTSWCVHGPARSPTSSANALSGAVSRSACTYCRTPARSSAACAGACCYDGCWLCSA